MATGDRREKEEIPVKFPPALLDSPTPPTACSHLLTVKSTLSKWELHSSFSFFEDLWYAGLGCRTFGCQQVRFAGGSPDKPQVPPSLGQAGSIPSEPGSSCCKLMVHPPPHTHTPSGPGHTRPTVGIIRLPHGFMRCSSAGLTVRLCISR